MRIKHFLTVVCWALVQFSFADCVSLDTITHRWPVTMSVTNQNVEFSLDSIPGCSYIIGVKEDTGSEIPFHTTNSYTCIVESVSAAHDYFMAYAVVRNECDESRTITQMVYVDKNTSRDVQLFLFPAGTMPTELCTTDDTLAFGIALSSAPQIPLISPVSVEVPDGVIDSSVGLGNIHVLKFKNASEGNYSLKVKCLGFDPPVEIAWNIRVSTKLAPVQVVAPKRMCAKREYEVTASCANATSYAWHWSDYKKVIAGTTSKLQLSADENLWTNASTDDKIYCVAQNACGKDSNFATVTIQKPFSEDIGIVSSYPDGSSNVFIAWNRSSSRGIDKYEILREETQDVFPVVKTLDYKAPLSFWIDSSTDARQQSYNYKLRTIDTCGNAAESNALASMHLIINKQSAQTEMSWNRYNSTAATYYKIYEVSNDYKVRREIGQEPASAGVSLFRFLVTQPKADVHYLVGYPVHEVVTDGFKTDTGPFSQSFSNMSEASVVQQPQLTQESNAITPNPAQQWFKLTLPAMAEVEIVSMDGRVVWQTTQQGATEIVVNCSNWKRGSYSVKIQSDNQQFEKKLFIE